MVSTLINRTISQRKITMENLLLRLNDEIIPVVRKIRSVTNVVVQNVTELVEASGDWLLLDGSNSPMRGNLDMGAYKLDNFANSIGDKEALTGGGTLTEILSYETGLDEGKSLRVGVEVLIWEAGDLSVMGHAVVEVSIYGTGSGISLSRTDFADTDAVPAGADVALTSSGTALVVQAQATTNDCYGRAKVWHQPKYALTA